MKAEDWKPYVWAQDGPSDSKLNWSRLSDEETKKIAKIVDRAESLESYQIQISLGTRTDRIRDIAAVHLGIGLKLDEFLNADEMDFVHDFFGIVGNMNRWTGGLVGFFPIFSKKRKNQVLLDAFHKVSGPGGPAEHLLRATEILSIRLTEQSGHKNVWEFRLNGKFQGTIQASIDEAKATALEWAENSIKHVLKFFE
jgi:hypothetical protein